MRVVQVVGELAPERCGVAHYTSRLARELSRAGATVAIASGPSTYACPVEFLEIPSSRWSFASLARLLLVARRWRADWLHLQYAPGSYQHARVVGLLPLLAKAIPGAPRVATTIHEYGGWPLGPPRSLAPVVDAAFSLAERGGWLDRESLALIGQSALTIVTNRHHLNVIRECSARLADRIEVIPIGPNVGPEVALEATRDTARAALGVPLDRFVVAFFGFVHPVKGIETLLNAMRLVRERRPDAVLWLIGGVESLALRGSEAVRYAAWVERTIAALGLRETARLTGYLSDEAAARRLRAADLAVLPLSHGVTLKSGSLITCLSYGLPVLATRGDEPSELQHQANVWLVPPRDPNALATAILRLAADPGLRARIASAGQDLAARFAWPEIARRHLALYSSRAPLCPGRGTAPLPPGTSRS
ncbi:MAG: glycosyltransferase [Chloroflexota bacterium]